MTATEEDRRNRRVLLIGFDSATPAIVEEGIAEGWLPNLARLRERGTYGRLRSTSDWLVSSHWPSFYLGVHPNEHGCYHFLQWRPDEMRLKRNDPAWMIREPFWRELAALGTRVVTSDVPYTHAPRTPGTSVELSGWATNELIFEPYAGPEWLEALARETYGHTPRRAGQGLAFERYAPLPLADLLRIRDQLVDIAGRSSLLVRKVMEREPWDLLLAVFGSVHRAGHLLWSGSSVEGEVGPEVERKLRGALRDVYMAVDAAVGEVVEAAGEDATVVVFSLIGMSDNTSRTDLLPTMLERILSDDPQAAPDHEKIGLAKRLRQAVPLRWRHAIKAGLPLAVQDRLSTFWRTGRVDWGRTRAFSLTADVHGYVRINLRGRESQGVVEPGTEYDRLCAEIGEGLMSFRDAATGEPVVAEVRRSDEIFPQGGRRRAALPDLIVRWARTPCARTAAVTSPDFGTIPWPTPGKNPNGRSGNHTAEGFVIAAGEGIRRDSKLEGQHHILDLAPTILSLMGTEPFPYMSGEVIQEIAPRPSVQRRTTG
jgi:predicted AlkP superfamily phosphohydrolase/phosphomutase